MDHPLPVGGLERFGHLDTDEQRLFDPQRPAGEAPGQILACDELHGQEVDAPLRVQAVDRGDPRVVDRGEEPRLALEARQPLGVAGEDLGEDLDRHLAPESGVRRLPHHAHAALADLFDQAVLQEILPGRDLHFRSPHLWRMPATIRSAMSTPMRLSPAISPELTGMT